MRTTKEPEQLASLMNMLVTAGAVHQRALDILCRSHRDENPGLILMSIEGLERAVDDLRASVEVELATLQAELGYGETS